MSPDPDTPDPKATDAPGPDLVALVGSRMGHDLANPIGAIANGVELLGLTGQGDSPEVALISESVENARRRIKAFRIAFGAAQPGQMVPAAELAEIVAPGPDGRRLEIDWAPGDLPRTEAKRILLALMCLESAMPWGGRARVVAADGGWRIEAGAERLRVEPALWAILEGAPAPADLAAGAVHFALLAEAAARDGRELTAQITETAIRLAF